MLMHVYSLPKQPHLNADRIPQSRMRDTESSYLCHEDNPPTYGTKKLQMKCRCTAEPFSTIATAPSGQLTLLPVLYVVKSDGPPRV